MNLKLALFFSVVAFISACSEAPFATEIPTNADKGTCDIRSSRDGSRMQDTSESTMKEQQPCSTDTASPHQGASQVPEDVPKKDMLLDQIHDVQETWKNLRNDRYAVVSSILIRLFKETTSQKFFSKFADVPTESLVGNEEYNNQVMLVADRLDSIITAMDDKVQLLDNIDYMKRAHIERGIPRGPWKDFRRILFDVLSSAGMSSKQLDSWKNVITIFINGIAPTV